MESAKLLHDRYATKAAEYYAQARSELLDHIPNRVRFVLDVGCSGGNFGQLLKKERDCIVWGIEPNAQAAAVAADKLDRVICKTFRAELAELEGQRFDCVTFN